MKDLFCFEYSFWPDLFTKSWELSETVNFVTDLKFSVVLNMNCSSSNCLPYRIFFIFKSYLLSVPQEVLFHTKTWYKIYSISKHVLCRHYHTQCIERPWMLKPWSAFVLTCNLLELSIQGKNLDYMPALSVNLKADVQQRHYMCFTCSFGQVNINYL